MEGEEGLEIVEQATSAETLPVIEAEEINPEGYGMSDFEPTAVFEEGNVEGASAAEEAEPPKTEEGVAKAEDDQKEEQREPTTEEDAKDARMSITEIKSTDQRRDSQMGPTSKDSLRGISFDIICLGLEEGESEEEEEIKEEYIPIDREPYYAQYRALIPERNYRKMKNNLLHRKMGEYFKKKKMEHVLKETDKGIDSQQKYDKKLQALAEFKSLETRERNSIAAELDDMCTQRDEHLSLLNRQFNAMQNREREIGTGLINTKTGKEIPKKLVEQLIKRQKDKTTEIANKRLFYIKLRDQVTEKREALHKLDVIGDNLHLIDYEQLQIEHTSYTDKVEERDEELTKLRFTCSGSLECLAHVREKSAALQIDLQQLKDQYKAVENEADDCRERLNHVKIERDKYRTDIDRLIEDSGLLTKPKLLIHMEQSLQEVKLLESQIEEHKLQYNLIQQQLKAIKENMERCPSKIESLSVPKEQIYKRRPTLYYPTLPPDAPM